MLVLVAEPSAPIANALKKFLDGTAEVQTVHFVDEAVQAVRARSPDLVIASVSASFDGEVLCQQVRKLPGETRVVLVYPPEELEQAAGRAQTAGADAFLIGPLKKHSVVSVTRLAARLRQALLRAVKAESTAKKPASVKASGGINTSDEAFFKKFMLIEVKRSRRYHYPVAVLLVSLDGLEVQSRTAEQTETVRAETMKLVADLLRDVDLAMPFADDKYLIFLPHTHCAGATVVAKRVNDRLRRLAALPEATASIGIASYDPAFHPRAQVSFAGLVREASARLKKAQEAGGDCFEGPSDPETTTEPPKPRKNRISMG